MTQPPDMPPLPPSPLATPPSADVDYQSRELVNVDSEHLKILSICWYVLAGMLLLGGCFPLLYVAMGVFILAAPHTAFGPGAPPPPTLVASIFAIMGGVGSLIIWITAILSFLTGRSLARRRRIVLCYITAAISCLFFPVGTALGVFTFVVLARPSVRGLFP